MSFMTVENAHSKNLEYSSCLDGAPVNLLGPQKNIMECQILHKYFNQMNVWVWISFLCVWCRLLFLLNMILCTHMHIIFHINTTGGRPLVPIVGGEWCPFTYQRNSSLIATVGICCGLCRYVDAIYEITFQRYRNMELDTLSKPHSEWITVKIWNKIQVSIKTNM